MSKTTYPRSAVPADSLVDLHLANGERLDRRYVVSCTALGLVTRPVDTYDIEKEWYAERFHPWSSIGFVGISISGEAC